jgi:uncharacterized membrane protein
MKRRHEITRLEAFSDAVFAFALTLLVVSLDVPKSVEELREMMLGFVPFALMFSMICWIWYEHSKFFRRYELDGALATALNCFLLFVVLFYVYPLKFLTNALVTPLVFELFHIPKTFETLSGGDTVLLLYSYGVVMIFGAFVALYWQAWRRRAELGLDADDLVDLGDGLRGNIISAGFGVVSVALVYIARATELGWVFGVAGFIYVLMGPAHAWNGFKTGRARESLKKKAAPAL